LYVYTMYVFNTSNYSNTVHDIQMHHHYTGNTVYHTLEAPL